MREALFPAGWRWGYYSMARPSRGEVIGHRQVEDNGPDTALTYNNVASTLADLGDLDGATKMYRNAMTIQEDFLGTKHPETITTYVNLASVMKDKGDCKTALTEYRKALSAKQMVPGKQTPMSRPSATTSAKP